LSVAMWDAQTWTLMSLDLSQPPPFESHCPESVPSFAQYQNRSSEPSCVDPLSAALEAWLNQ